MTTQTPNSRMIFVSSANAAPGPVDYNRHLTPSGHSQALRLHRRFWDSGLRFGCVVLAPTVRASSTGAGILRVPTVSYCGLPVFTLPKLYMPPEKRPSGDTIQDLLGHDEQVGKDFEDFRKTGWESLTRVTGAVSFEPEDLNRDFLIIADPIELISIAYEGAWGSHRDKFLQMNIGGECEGFELLTKRRSFNTLFVQGVDLLQPLVHS